MNAKEFYQRKLEILFALQKNIAACQQQVLALGDLEERSNDPDMSQFYAIQTMIDNLYEETRWLADAVAPLAGE